MADGCFLNYQRVGTVNCSWPLRGRFAGFVPGSQSPATVFALCSTNAKQLQPAIFGRPAGEGWGRRGERGRRGRGRGVELGQKEKGVFGKNFGKEGSRSGRKKRLK